ncbi:3-phosphoinositide-dependent protein kinase [Pseudocercospora fijiensis CIRAD86]|uniref:3-phosphoinositide-dependent protein kinase n=1 Tax=Pseudocercospora fijiensis (strain CIRAD86) TaxID=383855 RepID=M2ZPR3_PSEFD|nr:3-phosphoinositide-dependent protein kinase [Pseudocercospora fijiensis CIRAD86]EME81074.1 3-phosphoinositide-dependent protein kinase [Pseudocercospora fijiensis CIRAD86]
MDYETADGSQFSLREIWSEDEGNPEFRGTHITAFVDGNAYAGRSSERAGEMDDADVLQYLDPVPTENIFPLMPNDFTVAPAFDASKHYLKAPQFTYDDRLPGNTFVADCFLHEAAVLERLMKHPHPSIVTYFGCVVRNKRITHLTLKRYPRTLTELKDGDLPDTERQLLRDNIEDGIRHLHSLGLAHNDLNPDNVCIDQDGRPVIVDFDSCLPFGEPLMKGVPHLASDNVSLSDAKHDLEGLRNIECFLHLAPQVADQPGRLPR